MKLVSIIGTPSPFGQWGFAIAEKALRLLFPECFRIHALNFETFKSQFMARPSDCILYTSDLPDATVSDLLTKASSPTILFVEDPEQVVAYAIETRGLDHIQAVSFATRNFAGIHEISTNGSHLLFSGNDYEIDAVEVVAQLVRYMEPEVSEEVLTRVMNQCLINHSPGMPSSLSEQLRWGGLTDEQLPAAMLARQSDYVKATLHTICNSYRPAFESNRIDVVSVPRALFFFAAGVSAAGTIDLMGPARILVWGPYLHLPRGQWSAVLEFEVAESLSRNRLAFDVACSGEVLARGEATIPLQGVFTCEMIFDVISVEMLIEVRIFLASGAIEGSLMLRSASFLRC